MRRCFSTLDIMVWYDSLPFCNFWEWTKNIINLIQADIRLKVTKQSKSTSNWNHFKWNRALKRTCQIAPLLRSRTKYEKKILLLKWWCKQKRRRLFWVAIDFENRDLSLLVVFPNLHLRLAMFGISTLLLTDPVKIEQLKKESYKEEVKIKEHVW